MSWSEMVCDVETVDLATGQSAHRGLESESEMYVNVYVISVKVPQFTRRSIILFIITYVSFVSVSCFQKCN